MSQVNEYDVLEHIGSGAFGNVYKVKKQNGHLYARKEINVLHPMFGRTKRECDESAGKVINEINIVRQQLDHANIAQYYTAFTKNEKLYVVMELIDGMSLAERISSLRKKKENFQEPTIWYIFVQIIIALRYLHDEKQIIYRALTPNNIMLSGNNQITISDFSLARQKRSEYSKMNSTVETLVYSCPEVIQNHPYGEKADVWSAGCILYLMCTLYPPFTSNNVHDLATKIVKGEFKPISKMYSPKLIAVVNKCLTVKPEDRLDVIDVAREIVDEIMKYTDKLLTNIKRLKKNE